MLTSLSNYDLESVVQVPTREEFLGDSFVSSCIDHINVRAPEAVIRCAVITQKLADHYFVGCQLSMPNSSSRNNASSSRIEIVDRTSFDRLVESFGWNEFLISARSSTLYLSFVEQFARVEEASKRTYLVKKRRPDQPWLTADILAAIKHKEISWTRCRRSPNNAELRSQYVMERNHVTTLLRLAKRKYYNKKFSEANLTIKKVWSLINQLKGTGKKSSIDSAIEKGFGAASSAVVNSFNNFFASVSGVSHNDNVLPINLGRSCLSSAYLPQMTEDDPHLSCSVLAVKKRQV